MAVRVSVCHSRVGTIAMMSNPPTSSARVESATQLDPRLGSPLAVDGSTVRLQVPSRDEFASTVRVVVASIGADAGFSVDDIDDLRLAVSEVFSSFDTAPTTTPRWSISPRGR